MRKTLMPMYILCVQLFCNSRNKCAASIWVLLWTLALLPQTGPEPCHRNLHLTSKPSEQKACFCFWKTRIISHLVLYLSGWSRKSIRRMRFNASDPHQRRSKALSHGPKKTSKTHLHARVVRDLYCILAFTKWRKKKKKTPAFSDSNNGNRQPN